ncbi:Down syndrome cell adhesion molecule-like protein Dscam2 [Ostrinia furnacalis]|uniref:Down syndrome cell adhesion molecule-like protein Dscam2 n=1 Tax=Ostrinia furnacalis TaxID=93504 RepID=UPI00103E4B73|nr:Down syndrome cell adhesion molecule-like protein Dscam2 [Ostrinia furnacalis]
MSAQSVRVWWEPPPPASRGGVLLGYEVLYEAVSEPDSRPELRRAGGLEVALAGLARAANYSLGVRARTAAGPGPASDPVYCATHEDIPGAPADIKALANSEDTVIVSWLTPTQKNGKIKHYTVYSRPQRTGQHSQLTVAHVEGQEEYHVELRGLHEAQVYEVWVTAATAAGEGEMSAVVARKPNARAPATIWSFGRRVRGAAGRSVRLRCGAAGPAPARAWARRRPAPPLTADPRFHVDGEYLVIFDLDRTVSDNYTCTVRNPYGSERATWEVLALSPPARPLLRLTHAAPARLALAWDAPGAAVSGECQSPGHTRARCCASHTRRPRAWRSPGTRRAPPSAVSVSPRDTRAPAAAPHTRGARAPGARLGRAGRRRQR